MTKHYLILRYLLLKIQSQEIKKGQKLMSEGMLKIKFNCNRHTVAKVLNELKNKRIIKFIPGSGFFLIKTFEEEIDMASYIYYLTTQQKEFLINRFPIKLLANFSFTEIKKSFYNKFYNDIHIGSQYIFFTNNISNELIKYLSTDNIFKSLSYCGIVIFKQKKEIKFLNNDEGKLGIKDATIIVIKITLYDEHNKTIARIYNLVSWNFFAAHNKSIKF